MQVLSLLVLGALQAGAIDLESAARAFAAARKATDLGGHLFEVDLGRPLLLVDPATRKVVGDRPDPQGALNAEGDVFVGELPASVPLANTAIDWSGLRWALVLWPLPEDPRERLRLLVHESFHVAQQDLGLPAASPANAHLDAFDGRLLLQLEWRALRAALLASGEARADGARDALVFRARRGERCGPAAREEERMLELNEGLAEYAGVVLAGFGAADLARRLESAPARYATFTRSFAYESGPAYGLLLDDAAGPEWRRWLEPTSDLGALLAESLGVELPGGGALEALAEARSAAYDGQALRSSEAAREERRRARQRELSARFIDGPVLSVPLTPATRFSFDPGTLEALDGVGTLYPTLEMSGEWGTLVVERGGALIDSGWRHARVPTPREGDDPHVFEGDGYVLRLAEGWRLEVGERAGDKTVRPGG